MKRLTFQSRCWSSSAIVGVENSFCPERSPAWTASRRSFPQPCCVMRSWELSLNFQFFFSSRTVEMGIANVCTLSAKLIHTLVGITAFKDPIGVKHVIQRLRNLYGYFAATGHNRFAGLIEVSGKEQDCHPQSHRQ